MLLLEAENELLLWVGRGVLRCIGFWVVFVQGSFSRIG